MAKPTDDELIGLIEAEEKTAYGINDAELSDARALALRYYNGEPFGNEVEGRSQVVSRDVLDVIESALPQLLKPFVSGDQVVKFEPVGPEDEAAAEQETDYVNHVVTQKNDGFAVFYTWFKDGLLSKNGYVKVCSEEYDRSEETLYEGLTDGQYQMLLQDANVEALEHTATPDEDAARQLQQQAQMLQQAAQMDPNAAMQLQQLMAMPAPQIHAVRIRVVNKGTEIKIYNCAPEDIMVSSDCRQVSVQKARFVQHRSVMSRSDIEAQGWNAPKGPGDASRRDLEVESLARDLYNEQNQDDADTDEFLVKDTYILVAGERIRVVVIGSEVVHRKNGLDIVPIATLTPHIMPHRHIGMSYSDLTEDVQLIKSTLLRGQLDNMYLLNNGRHFISERVNLEDMLTSRPGGVVRVKGQTVADAAQPIINAPFPPTSFSMVEYFDSVKEKRTGITAYNQGMDADSLNKTASGVSQIMSAAQQRLELVARTFAETGVKELFMLVHYYVRTTFTKPDVVRLRNKWVDVDPRQWKTRTDMTISVGLGTGNKDQQLMHLGNMYAMASQELAAGIPTTTPENLYNIRRQLVINAGFKQPEQYVTDPANSPPKPPPPPDPKIVVTEMQLKADQEKTQAEFAMRQQEGERKERLDIQKFQAETQINREQAEQSAVLEQQRSENDAALKREEMMLNAQLKREEMQLKAELELEKARIAAETRREEMAHEDRMAERQTAIDMKKHSDEMELQKSPKKVIRDRTGRISEVA